MTGHSFVQGTAALRPVRSNRQPLTLDQIRAAAPSAFAEKPYDEMSTRYTYIPTVAIIEHMMKAGFMPFSAAQSRTAIEDKRSYTKHIIKFRPDMTLTHVGNTFPEVALVNSHDGSSAYKLMAALYRLACENGLIVADSTLQSISVKHTGNILTEVASGSVQIVDRMPAVIDTVARWRELQLTAGEQAAFAGAAHVVRFADAEGKVETPIRAEQLLRTRRTADAGSDLWSVFNRVQENVIKGGLHAYKPGATQRTTTREIKGIDQDVRLNRALWILGEKMAQIKTAAPAYAPEPALVS